MNATELLGAEEALIDRARRNGEELLALLERAEDEGTPTQERDTILLEVEGRLRAMKKERDQLIGHLAEEANLIDEIETRAHELRRAKGEGFHIVPPAPTNAQIDSAERKRSHFAQGTSVYKLFWMFFAGSVLGVFAERIWCVLRYGFYEPRVGSIYGPFNPVYGLAAAVLTLTLYGFRNRGRAFSFFGGAVIGSAVEYACSLVQEWVFGSASWDYSGRPFNLGGRICLLYSVYWGVLGMLFIKEFYPRIAQLILKIPNNVGRPLTCVLAVLMAADMAMTGLSILRWAERREAVPASGMLDAYFDSQYPDERMEKIFTNLEFVDERDERRQRSAQAGDAQAARDELW